MPPAIIDAANAHRAALLAREQATMQAMARRWLGVEQSLNTATEVLAHQMANGDEPVTVSQLMRSQRYQELRRQLNAELRRYNAYADETITNGQRNMITDALTHSQALITAAALEAQMAVQFNRLPVSTVERMVGLAGDGSPLMSVLNDATAGAGDALAQRLVSGVALGQNPIEVARQAIRAGVGQSFTRIATIGRTEMLRAYRVTTLEQYQASRVVTAYRRLSARDERTCPACLFADGQVYELGESFDQHPNCRCTMIPVLRNVPPVQYETGREWFSKQPEYVQRQMLGPSRYAAWSKGKISFDDIINRTSSSTWGGAITTKSVKALGIPTVAPVRSPRVSIASPATLPAPRRGLQRTSTPASNEAARLQQAWVHGSNSRASITMKEAVRNEFGVRRGIIYNPRGHEIPSGDIAAARPVVRGMYEKTQAYFREQGITELKLYRGVKSETNVHGVIESWTSDLKTARKFNGHDIMEQTIPVDRILLAHNGPGWKNGRYGQQYEFVVMP